jgi:3-deoxy-7-phosphoheptulonate synthase
MIVVMRRGAPRPQVDEVLRRLGSASLPYHVFEGEERVVIAVLGELAGDELGEVIEILPGVEEVGRTTRPYRLASREVHQMSSEIPVGSVRVGRDFVLAAGAARIHQADELVELAVGAGQAGAQLFWLGRPEGADLAVILPLLAHLRRRTDLPLLVDVWGPEEFDPLGTYCNGFVVGPQHLHSYPLIRGAARQQLPVLLTRGQATSVEEWLLVAEQLLKGGNFNVILCEQGIRTFETASRSTMDFAALAIVRRLSHLPVVANPSLAAGRHELVPSLALGAAGAGAHGVLIDVHLGQPDESTSGPQSLSLSDFARLARRLTTLATALAQASA